MTRNTNIAKLYHHFSFQFVSLSNYDLILNCLNRRTLYSRHLDALFLINVLRQNKLSLHYRYCWYSHAHKENNRIFYILGEQCNNTVI
jgi:hypothetical protein